MWYNSTNLIKPWIPIGIPIYRNNDVKWTRLKISNFDVLEPVPRFSCPTVPVEKVHVGKSQLQQDL